MTERNDGASLLLTCFSTTYVHPPARVCPACVSLVQAGGQGLGMAEHGPSSSLLAWCPGHHAAPGPGQSLAGAWLSSHMALILLFSGPAWDILHFPSLPLWEPLSPPLHLASGDAREGAVASRAWLGTRDPRRQLRQYDEHHLHPLWICTYSLCLQPGPLSAPCPALPCPALPTTILAHCSLSFIFLVRE